MRHAAEPPLDTELTDLPPERRWRVWMGRVEAVIFAAAQPVPREVLAAVVGRACDLDALLADIRNELESRPYELVRVAGGWQHRTRPEHAATLRAARVGGGAPPALSPLEEAVLLCVAYFQPVTRDDISGLLGRQVSRDTIGRLRAIGVIANGPRSPLPGAPVAFVTTAAFLAQFGLDGLQDLSELDTLREAGLLSKAHVLARIGAPLAPEDLETGARWPDDENGD